MLVMKDFQYQMNNWQVERVQDDHRMRKETGWKCKTSLPSGGDSVVLHIMTEIQLDKEIHSMSVSLSVHLSSSSKSCNIGQSRTSHCGCYPVCHCVKSELVFAELSDPSDSTWQRGSGDRFWSRSGGGGASC